MLVFREPTHIDFVQVLAAELVNFAGILTATLHEPRWSTQAKSSAQLLYNKYVASLMPIRCINIRDSWVALRTSHVF